MIGIVACFLIWQSKNIFTWNNKIASLGNYIADYTALAHANEANKARLNHWEYDVYVKGLKRKTGSHNLLIILPK